MTCDAPGCITNQSDFLIIVFNTKAAGWAIIPFDINVKPTL